VGGDVQITFRKTGDRTLETTALRDDDVTAQLRGSYRKSELLGAGGASR
jgi:hypothetical protein